MYSPQHSPCQQHEGGEEEEDEHGDEETLAKPHNADVQVPQTPESPIHQNPQHSGMLSPSTTPFPLPPIAIDYPPAITDAHVVSKHPEPPLTSPSGGAVLFEGCFYNKRKKGKLHLRKQQSIIRKYETLLVELNPIPFDPPKILYFAKHEGLLRRLGLWDFVQVEFDSGVKVDLISQLVASYDPRHRCSYVNGTRVAVNRADLARAFKLPVKKGASNVVGDGAVLGSKGLSEEEEKESIAFMEEFLSNWLLLHEDTWMMPSEVLNWTRMIKDGHLEKVDWATLLWFMVEKELMQGKQLRDCYYASHLQHLIKSQHEEVFSLGETQKLESYVEVKDDESGGNKDDVKSGAVGVVQEGKGVSVEGPNIELSLGQDGGGKGGEVRDEEMMDVEEGNEGEEGDTNEENIEEGGDIVEEKGGVAEDEFDVGPNHDTSDGDGLTGNVLQFDQMDFTSQQRFGDHLELLAASSDMPHVNSASQSYYGTGGKRGLVDEDNMFHESINGSNKRLKIVNQWDNGDFKTIMEQINQVTATATMLYEEEEITEQQLIGQNQFLLNEIQKRDEIADDLRHTKYKELQKRDEEISRLRREINVMGSLVEGYREALKEIQNSFSEYRKRVLNSEQPVYRDPGPVGTMLSAEEVERQRLKQEEEHQQMPRQEEEHQERLIQEEEHLAEEPSYGNTEPGGGIQLCDAEVERQRSKQEEEECRLLLEEKAKEVAEEYLKSQLHGYEEKVRVLGERLGSHEAWVKQLKESRGNQEVSKSEQQSTENPESPANA